MTKHAFKDAKSAQAYLDQVGFRVGRDNTRGHAEADQIKAAIRIVRADEMQRAQAERQAEQLKRRRGGK